MDPLIKTLTFLVSLVGVLAAIYNIVSTRSHAQDTAQRGKVEQALALGLKNENDIKHLRETGELREEATKGRLDKIGEDTSWMRDMFTKWLLDPNRKP